jgi:uncharacterized protein DUF6597
MKSQQFTIPNIDTVFKFYKPKPPLSKFVETLWLYEGYGGYKAEEKTETILPTGTLELVINLRQNRLRSTTLNVRKTARAFPARSSQALMDTVSRVSLRLLLAVELLLFEWRPQSFIPVAIAAAVAAVIRVQHSYMPVKTSSRNCRFIGCGGPLSAVCSSASAAGSIRVYLVSATTPFTRS